MSETAFIEYALSPGLSLDERHTLDLLIDWALDWEASSIRKEARNDPGYSPVFSRALVESAAGKLVSLTWLSLQGLISRNAPVRDLTPLKFLDKLEGLSLGQNQIHDIAALSACAKLRRLHLADNHVRDLSPLAACTDLEEVEVRNNPLDDMTSLESLPKLKELELSVGQLSSFRRLRCFPALVKLHLGNGEFDSFEGFPHMPVLTMIWGANPNSLAGMELMPSLQNLVNFGGKFESLEPLRSLIHLTHIHMNGCHVRDTEPLRGLLALRDVFLWTESSSVSIEHLDSLPALHSLSIKCQGTVPYELEQIRSGLTSWDVEFLSPTPRHSPSLALEVVDQATFDYYDSKAKYGVGPKDTNRELLASERDWVMGRVQEVLETDFTEDDDFYIPYQWAGGRSATVMLMSEQAVESFRTLVLGIQEVLATCRYDWIIYFQSDCCEENFIVWIYPDKLVLTEEYEARVNELIAF